VFKVLEYAGIQSGNKTYRPETLSLGDVVDEALADCRWVLEEKGIEVERDIAPDLPLVVADRAALRMAVQNLLDNAVKYAGAAGWIGVRGHAHSVDPDAREVCLIVEDRGPGIQAEDRPHLFEPFYRGREVAGGTIHGSGLGLSLVRHAVEAQHGSPQAGPEAENPRTGIEDVASTEAITNLVGQPAQSAEVLRAHRLGCLDLHSDELA